MYILFFEDGIAMKALKISRDDINSADDGDLDIINIVDPERPVQYVRESNDQSEPLETIGEE